MAHKLVGINALSAYILFSSSSPTSLAMDQIIIIPDTIDIKDSQAYYNCSSAAGNDTCTIRCQAQDPQGAIILDCGNAGHCEIHCEAKKCMGSASILNAQNSNTLSIIPQNTDAQKCMEGAVINLPDSGNATLLNYPGLKTFQKATINAGNNTQNILINCTDGGTNANDDCKQMTVNAQTAQYLEIQAGANTDITGVIINCPRGSLYAGPNVAPCILDISGGGLIADSTVNTLGGVPFDFWIKNDDESGIIETATTLTISCSADNQIKDIINGNSSKPLRLSSSNLPNCMQATQAPTASTTVPSNTPSATATTFPSVPTPSPSLAPSISPSKTPSSIPTSASTNPTNQPSTTETPSKSPSIPPSRAPSTNPSGAPSRTPSGSPSVHPSTWPSTQPSVSPTNRPSASPSSNPSQSPTSAPTQSPSLSLIKPRSSSSAYRTPISSLSKIILTCIASIIIICLCIGICFMYCVRRTRRPERKAGCAHNACF